MLTAIISTHESERALVPTLAALVPGSTSGLIIEVIVADAGSRDATAEVADIAGCRFIASPAPLGARLKEAAASARAPWLLFLHAGSVPDASWIAAAGRFMDETGPQNRAAMFRASGGGNAPRPALAEIAVMLGAMLGAAPKPVQGLLIAKRFYQQLGGHPDGANAETALLRRLGRRRITLLASRAMSAR